MTDRKFTVSPGDEIVITVPKRTPTGNELLLRRPSAPKGMIRTRRNADFLPRRLSKKGLINFFDTAQTKIGGEWITKNHSILGDVSWQEDLQGGSRRYYPKVEPLTDAQISQMQSPLVTNESITGARKIEKTDANVFGIIVIGVDANFNVLWQHSIGDENFENWTTEGLQLTDAERAAFSIYVINYSQAFNTLRQFIFLIINPAVQKITVSYDFNAPGVENFRLRTDAKIYLIPEFVLSSGSTSKNLNGLVENNVYLNFIHRFLPRYFNEPGAIFETNLGEIEAYDRAVAVPPTRTFSYDFFFNDPLNPTYPAPGGTFWTENTYRDFDISYGNNYSSQLTDDRIYLTGIIRQDGKDYYFWSVPA